MEDAYIGPMVLIKHLSWDIAPIRLILQSLEWTCLYYAHDAHKCIYIARHRGTTLPPTWEGAPHEIYYIDYERSRSLTHVVFFARVRNATRFNYTYLRKWCLGLHDVERLTKRIYSYVAKMHLKDTMQWYLYDHMS